MLRSEAENALDAADSSRLSEVLAFITNLEHAGDVVEKGLMACAAKRLKRGLSFSAEGQAEIRTMVERLAANIRSATAVFLTNDPRAARALLAEKKVYHRLGGQQRPMMTTAGRSAHRRRPRNRHERRTCLVKVRCAEYRKAGPLLFSLDHRGEAGGKPVHVFFSNVAVKLAGSDTWIEAQ